tara:strand:- start:9600 stop:10145 length:546 start_codon:yes stop_codon:yes gene_type:complete
MSMDTLSQWLASHYIHIKFIHISFATLWLWSTSVAYLNYLVPVLRAWQANPDDIDSIKKRNWAMERFDDGVILEHTAFPAVLISGLALLLISGWGPQSYWLAMKLTIVVLVFLPIECLDYWLSHFGGNKAKIRRSLPDGDSFNSPHYELAIHRHWWFLIVTTPVIAIGGMTVLYLAIVKPM